MKQAAFLEAIREHPGDDAPRLVYADWLDEHGDPDRAEFIRTQCRLAGLGEDDPARDALELRERALLAGHGAAWREELPPWARKGAVFRRGFVEGVTARAGQFVRGAGALFAAATVRHAWLTYPYNFQEPPSRPDPALAACPFLARLTSLKLGGSFGGAVGDDGVRTLVASPHLANLETLDLGGNQVTAAGVRAVAESPHLPALAVLDLSGDRYGRNPNPGGDEGAAILAGSARLAGLRELRLERSEIGPAGAAALADSPHLRRLARLHLPGNPLGPRGGLALAGSRKLTELAVLNLAFARLDTAAAEALLTSRNLARLADIDLSANDVDPRGLRRAFAGKAGTRLRRLALGYGRLGAQGISLLAPLRLRSLGLGSNQIGAEGARALAGLPLLEHLRELDLGVNQLGDAGARVLAEAPRAASLRVLDLYHNNITAAGAAALADSPHLARLRVLGLIGNRIGNHGGRALLASPHLGYLTRLRLHDTYVVRGIKEELSRRFGDAVEF
jgi:uncharacterized protein (TIGR02996 family)